MSSSSEVSGYGRYVLTLAALTHAFAVAVPVMCLPVLFKEISDELQLSLVQIGAIWGMAPLAGMFSGLMGGMFGDRFGTRRTLTVLCLLAGVAGASRGLAGGFLTLSATVLLFGFLVPSIPTNVHKTCGVWFSARRLGLANGVASMGMALGFMLGSLISATYLSPWLGGWRNVLLLYGAISVAISVPWLLSRDAPSPVTAAPSPPDAEPARRGLSHVVRLRSIWFLGLTLLGVQGCVLGTLGYLPLYLRGVGWPGAQADGALAVFHGVSMLFTIPLALFSDRLASRKTVLIGAVSMTIMGTSLLSVAGGAWVWVAVIMAGIVRDGFMAVLITTVIETEGVGPGYAGTAVGLILAFSGVGGMIGPPLGNSLASIDPAMPFAFWAALAVGGLASLTLVKEGKGRARGRQLR
jgi:NNP family nitrate/nitrite transporter-like MFS transporter